MVTPLQKYASFEGRARRKEYWWFYLLAFGVVLVGAIIDNIIFGPEALAESGGLGAISGLALLALLLPSLAVSVRRLHDHDKSGWFLLLGLIPIVSLILLYWYVTRGTAGPNRFGPDPLGVTGTQP